MPGRARPRLPSLSVLSSRETGASAARRCKRGFSRERATLIVKPGLRRDFQALWNTQYFEDIRLEVQDSPNRPNAKIVIFHLTERPIIRRIEYRGLKSISESDILDRFKDRKVSLSVESQFDPTKIKKAEVVIKDLEAEHGRQFAVVKPTYEKIPATNAVKLIFTYRGRRQGQSRADFVPGQHGVFRPEDSAVDAPFQAVCDSLVSVRRPDVCRKHSTAPSWMRTWKSACADCIRTTAILRCW